MDYTLKELLDIPKVSDLLNSLNKIYCMPVAIIDTEGKTLIASAWQEICTKFHRKNPDTEKQCIKSNLQILEMLGEEKQQIVYRCPMGLMDSATPIIIESKYLGVIISGQIFTSPPEEALFIELARQYRFDQIEYIEAMKKVPIFSEEQLQVKLQLIHSLAQMLAEQGLQNLRQHKASEALQKSEEKFRHLFNNAEVGIFRTRLDGSEVLDVNEKFLSIVGMTREETIGNPSVNLWVDPKEREEMVRRITSVGRVIGFEYKMRHKQLGVRNCLTSLVLYPEQGTLEGSILDITERIKAEEELKNVTQRLKLATTSANLGVWDWNVRDNYMVWDDRMLELYGISRDNFSNNIEAWMIGLHPEDKEAAIAEVQAALKGENKFDTFFRICHSDGVVKYIRATGLVIRGADETPNRMIGINVDITQRKLAEIANSRSLLRQRAILDNLPMLAWLKDKEGRLEMINEPFAAACGLTIEESIGKTDIDIWPEALAKGYMADDREICLSGQKKHVEEAIATPVGEKWHLTYKTPIFDECELVIGTAGIALDITERKQSEVALRQERDRAQSLLDTVETIIVALNTDGIITTINRKGCQVLGYMEEELLGRSWFSTCLPQPDGIDSVYPFFLKLISGEIDQNEYYENLIVTSNGEVRQIAWHNTIIYDEHGQIAGTLSAGDDVTEYRQAEEEKATLEKQLHQAQKMESIGRLAGGVAHDFNNMLTVILGHAELGLRHLDPSHRVHGDLKEICNTAGRSADLTRQLLAFARKQTIMPKELDLNETVTGMFKMLQRIIGEDIHLAWHPMADLWRVKADATQIDQILANLCVNARDAISDVGKITIESANHSIDKKFCKSHIGMKPGKFVRLSVNDNGNGMDKETLAHIFEPFFTTKELGKGTGLGLSTVYGAVKQNNGFIDVSSEPGVGTTFSIYLPCYEDKTRQTMNEGTIETSPQGKETILLVEDEPAILRITSNILTEQGYNVIEANTPKEAIQLAREHTCEIHLLLTDVVMPEMNGRDLAKHLKLLNPHLKCLYMSGHTADVIANSGVLTTEVQFIQKPFTINNLAVKLREILDNQSLSFHASQTRQTSPVPAPTY